MPKLSIMPYNRYSKSASNIIEACKTLEGLGSTMRISREGGRWSSFRSQLSTEPHTVALWGSVEGLPMDTGPNRLLLNGTAFKADYTNKRHFFDRFYSRDGLLLPNYFTLAAHAQSYLNTVTTDNAPKLVERHTLTGHSGEGIRLLKHGDQVDPNAKLWTVYIKKAEEYRVHFFKGLDKFIYQQKRLKSEVVDNTNENTYKVRNWQNGWVYCRENLEVPFAVVRQADFFATSPLNDLDYGAIDIIYNARHQAAFILEVNLAPGAEGTTALDYAKAFKEYMDTHDFTTISGKYTSRVV